MSDPVYELSQFTEHGEFPLNTLGIHTYSIEASDLGWASGHWPERITVRCRGTEISVPRRAALLYGKEPDIEFGGYEYYDLDTWVGLIRVLND